MKKALLFLTAAALLCTGCGQTVSDSTANPVREDMSAADYAADMGLGINLGNTMEAYWEDLGNTTSGCMTIGDNTPQNYETCWGAEVTTQETIDGFRDAGFRTVRIPVYWGNMMEDDGTYTISDTYFQRIDEIIQYCLEDDLYAVINIHHYDSFLIKYHEKEEVLAAAEQLWKQIASHYSSYDDHLIFEGFNESLGNQREEDNYDEDALYDYINEINQTFVDAVRSTGGNNAHRPLIVSGYWTNIDKTTDARFQIPEDSAENKLMVSVHYIDNAMYWSNQIGGEAWQTYSTQQCELLRQAFSEQDIPVFVGECTSIYEDTRFANDAVYTDSAACLSWLLELAADYHFVPVLWDVSNNFYSRTEYKINSERDQEVITAYNSYLREANPS